MFVCVNTLEKTHWFPFFVCIFLFNQRLQFWFAPHCQVSIDEEFAHPRLGEFPPLCLQGPRILINTTLMVWATTIFLTSWFSNASLFMVCIAPNTLCSSSVGGLQLYTWNSPLKDDPAFPGPALSLPVPHVPVLVALITSLNPNSPVFCGGFPISLIWEFLRFSIRIVGHCIHN